MLRNVHVDIVACIRNTTLTIVGCTGHNLDEHCLIFTRSWVNGQPFHDDAMPMGWGMNGDRTQLECQLKCGMIAMDEGTVCIPEHVWSYLAIHGVITTMNVLVTIETLWKHYK